MAMLIIMERPLVKGTGNQYMYYPKMTEKDRARFEKLVELLREKTGKPPGIIEDVIMGTLNVACRHLDKLDIFEVQNIGIFRKLSNKKNQMHMEFIPFPNLLVSLEFAGFRVINARDN